MKLTDLMKTSLIDSIDETDSFLHDCSEILRVCSNEDTLIYNLKHLSKRVNILNKLLKTSLRFLNSREDNSKSDNFESNGGHNGYSH